MISDKAANVMKPFFAPATALMNHLKYPQKFMLIGLLLVLPLSFVMWQYVGKANDDIEFNSKERIGVEYLEPISEMLRLVQLHMALSAAAEHDPSKTADLEATLDAITAQV